jgi:soluble lytic murein transglycosylase-like protein
MGSRVAVLLCVAAALVVVPAEGRADMYRCEGPGGALHFTNVRTPGMRCRVLVRDERPSGSRRGSRAAASSRRPDAASLPERAERYRLYDGFIQEASALYQLPAAFIRAVVKVESDFNPRVVSSTGAMGLMQLMPRTAQAMGVRDPFDPRQNIFGGSRYLRVLANLFNGDLVLTIAGYNAGEGAVMRYRGVPPYDETRRYVRRVLQHYYAFRNAVAHPLAPR